MECVGDGSNGVIVTELTDNGAFERDGTLKVGDFLLSINNESLRRCTQSQARSILKRTQLLSTDIAYVYEPQCRLIILNCMIHLNCILYCLYCTYSSLYSTMTNST